MTRFALAASAAISLFAATGIAHAGEVISDQRYWPGEVFSEQRYWPNYYWPNEVYGPYTGQTRPGFNAMASMGLAYTPGSSFVYRGGPKTGIRDYTPEPW